MTGHRFSVFDALKPFCLSKVAILDGLVSRDETRLIMPLTALELGRADGAFKRVVA